MKFYKEIWNTWSQIKFLSEPQPEYRQCKKWIHDHDQWVPHHISIRKFHQKSTTRYIK